eukprot:1178671-Prorocentrum_minimum.AAC.2
MPSATGLQILELPADMPSLLDRTRSLDVPALLEKRHSLDETGQQHRGRRVSMDGGSGLPACKSTLSQRRMTTLDGINCDDDNNDDDDGNDDDDWLDRGVRLPQLGPRVRSMDLAEPVPRWMIEMQNADRDQRIMTIRESLLAQ